MNIVREEKLSNPRSRDSIDHIRREPGGVFFSALAQGSSCKKVYLDAGAIFFAMSENLALQKIAPLIHEIRGQRVMLDSDLARIYGVPIKALNQAVKRNAGRFPEDFAFQLTNDEWQALRSQFVTLKRGQHRKFLPHAFTEHGAIMAANVLNSKEAVEMSVFVVRAFVKVRETLATHKELADKLTELERKVGTHDKAIGSIIAAVRAMTESPKRSRAIGFRVKGDTKADGTPNQHVRRARKK